MWCTRGSVVSRRILARPSIFSVRQYIFSTSVYFQYDSIFSVLGGWITYWSSMSVRSQRQKDQHEDTKQQRKHQRRLHQRTTPTTRTTPPTTPQRQDNATTTTTSTNQKLGQTVCNFANFGRTNMIQVGTPLVLLFLIVSLLWVFLQVSFWWRYV